MTPPEQVLQIPKTPKPVPLSPDEAEVDPEGEEEKEANPPAEKWIWMKMKAATNLRKQMVL